MVFHTNFFVKGVIFTSLDVVSAPLLSSKAVKLVTAVSPSPRLITVDIYKKYTAHWNELSYHLAWGNIIRFCCAEFNFSLKFVDPDNSTSTQGENISSSIFQKYRILVVLIVPQS